MRCEADGGKSDGSMQHGNKVRQPGTSQVWMDDELATSLERQEGERLVRHAYLRARRVVVRKRLHHASSCEEEEERRCD